MGHFTYEQVSQKPLGEIRTGFYHRNITGYSMHSLHLKRSFLLLPFVLILLGASLSACGGSSNRQNPSTSNLEMAPMAGMPDEVQQAPVSVQQAYQYAVANPDTLKQIPCYCGCGTMGHASNYACYVSGVASDGKISFDPHALGCSICVDITQDVMRLKQAGKSTTDVRAYVDQTYAKYGPSNMK